MTRAGVFPRFRSPDFTTTTGVQRLPASRYKGLVGEVVPTRPLQPGNNMTTHLMMTIEGLTGTLVSSEYNRLARFSPELLELVTSLVTRAAERVETAVRKEMEEDAREAAEDAAEAARAEAEEDDEAAEAEEDDDHFDVTCPDCGLEFVVYCNEEEEKSPA